MPLTLTVSLDETETDEGFVPVVTFWLDDDDGEATPVGLFWPEDVDTIVQELEEAIVEFSPDELRFAGFEGV